MAHLKVAKMRAARVSACLIGLSIAGPSGSAPVDMKFDPQSLKQIEAWKSIATAQPTSPAPPQADDLTVTWVAADGRHARLVVREPRRRTDAAVLVVPPAQEGADSRALLEDTFRHAADLGAARIILLGDRYEIGPSADGGGGGGLRLKGLHDLTLDGRGSTLVFTRAGDGLRLEGITRVKITNLVLDYAVSTWGLGRIVDIAGERKLHLLTASNEPTSIAQLSTFDPATGRWPAGGLRIFFRRGNRESLVDSSKQEFSSPRLATLPVGSILAAKFHIYQGAAITVADSADGQPSDDVIIDRVSIKTASGMGLRVVTRGRGVAFVHSSITPPGDGRAPMSTEYDGVAVAASAGDILIADNVIRGQGDDAVNVHSPISGVFAGTSSSSLRLQKPILAKTGDEFAFFDADGLLLGSRRLLRRSDTSPTEDPEEFEFDGQNLPGSRYARNLSLLASRVVIQGNRISNCECHGVLLQTPNALVAENSFAGLRFNAIRLLTSLDPWREGVGPLNVVVRNNTVDQTGPDAGIEATRAAITVYGQAGPRELATPTGADVLINDNIVRTVAQACIRVSGAVRVRSQGNQCLNLMRAVP